MDRVGASFEGSLKMMKERLNSQFIPIQIPIGEGEMFTGMIDLIDMKMRISHDETQGDDF